MEIVYLSSANINIKNSRRLKDHGYFYIVYRDEKY